MKRALAKMLRRLAAWLAPEAKPEETPDPPKPKPKPETFTTPSAIPALQQPPSLFGGPTSHDTGGWAFRDGERAYPPRPWRLR